MWICSHPKDAWRITFPCFELLNLRLRFNLQLRGLKLLIEKKTKSFQQKTAVGPWISKRNPSHFFSEFTAKIKRKQPHLYSWVCCWNLRLYTMKVLQSRRFLAILLFRLMWPQKSRTELISRLGNQTSGCLTVFFVVMKMAGTQQGIEWKHTQRWSFQARRQKHYAMF